MRISNIFKVFAVIAMFAFAAFAQNERYVQSKQSINVYQNEIRKVYEEAVATIPAGEVLTILDTKKDMYKVRTSNGTEGWIEKRLVQKVGKSKTFTFSDAEVIGYLDNPTPVYILDSDDPNAERIYLDRSFKDALSDNVDRETIERQTK